MKNYRRATTLEIVANIAMFIWAIVVVLAFIALVSGILGFMFLVAKYSFMLAWGAI